MPRKEEAKKQKPKVAPLAMTSVPAAAKEQSQLRTIFDEKDDTGTYRLNTETTPPPTLETDEQSSMYVTQSERPHQTSRVPFRLDSLRDFNPDEKLKGYLPTSKSNKPPQSVASINFSQLEDATSEAVIRAYKKKKAELETLRD